jgi:hypothetical protein
MGPRRHFVAGGLALALVALWATSMLRPATFVVDGGLHFTLGSGGLGLCWSRRDAAEIIHLDLQGLERRNCSFTSIGGLRGGGGSVPQLRGTAFITLNEMNLLPWSAGGSRVQLVYVPVWPALLLVLALAAHCWRVWPLPSGFCPRCRYDMRSLPSARSCPECGTPQKAAHQRASVIDSSTANGAARKSS